MIVKKSNKMGEKKIFFFSFSRTLLSMTFCIFIFFRFEIEVHEIIYLTVFKCPTTKHLFLMLTSKRSIVQGRQTKNIYDFYFVLREYACIIQK